MLKTHKLATPALLKALRTHGMQVPESPCPIIDGEFLAWRKLDENTYYQGEWLNGKIHGQGIAIFPNHQVSIGHFFKGEQNGPDITLDKAGTVRIRNLIKGKFHGEQVLIAADGQQSK